MLRAGDCLHVQIDIFLRLFLLHASLAFHRGHPTRTGATQPRAFAESGQECVRGRFHRVPVVATRERPLRVRSNPRPPDRSPSDEPAAPHPVFPPFAVAAGPRTPTDVIPNKFVEANGAAREVLEKGFRFTPRNLGIFAVFGIAVPVLIYKGCVDEFVRAQDSLRDRKSFRQTRPRFFPSRRIRERFPPRTATRENPTDRVSFPRKMSPRPRTALHG